MPTSTMDTIMTLANLLCGRRNEYARAAAILRHADEALQAKFSGLIAAFDAMEGIRTDTSALLAEYGKADPDAVHRHREGENGVRTDYQEWEAALGEMERLANPLSPLTPVLQATWPPKQGSFGIYECLGECFTDMQSARVHYDGRREAALEDAYALISQAERGMRKAISAPGQMWNCVLSDRIDMEGFRMAREIYDYYFYIPAGEQARRSSENANHPTIDSLLAQAMVYSRVSPDMLGTLNPAVRALTEMMCAMRNGVFCRTLASGFAWIGEAAASLEITVLRAMLDAGLPEMDATLQERINFLGDKETGAPGIKLVAPHTNSGVLAVDFDSLSWSEAQYGTFFRRLVQADQPLHYALAVSEWKQSFFPQSPWNFDAHTQKLCDATEQEYDGLVTAQKVTVQALLEGGVPIEQVGVLFRPSNGFVNLDYLAMLFQASKLRRNVSLRLYTLYLPPAVQSGEQMRNMKPIALSIKQNTNPEAVDLINDIRNYIAETGEFYANAPEDAGLY